MIKITELNKYYNKGKENEIHVINHTSIELPDTGLFCILGESGCGKTTLLNTISGLDEFSGGTIQVDDVTIKKFGSKKQENIRNEKFGYIFQNYYLLLDRTVDYNIRLSLNMYDLSEEEKEERVDYVLKAVDMFRFKKRMTSQLSGGQQQRVAIARALAKSPKVIFADEPTGNLDEVNTMKIMGILKKIAKDCLVVVVTHERSIAEFFADKIIWIEDGKIHREQEKNAGEAYTYQENHHIYLQEYKKSQYQNNKVNIEIYSNEELPQIGLQLIYDNGKYYLYAVGHETAVEYLTQNDEKKVVDGKRPKLEIQDVDNNTEYMLETLKSVKAPKLSGREKRRAAKSNLRQMGKKQLLLMLALVVMSVLVVLTVQDMMTLLHIDKQKIVSTDSHYLAVDMEKNEMISTDEQEQAIGQVIDAMKESGISMEINVAPSISMTYQYEGFWQLEEVTGQLENYSIVNAEYLSEKDLICGRMPEKVYEVVVDKWVLENFITGENEFSNMITNVEHFNGKEFKVSKSDARLTVVGISDSGEPNVYMKKTEGAAVSGSTKRMSDIITAAKTFSEYADVKLEDNEVLVSEKEMEELRNSYLWKNYRKWMEYEESVKSDEEYYEYLEKQYEEEKGGEDEWLTREYIEELRQESEKYLKSVEKEAEEISKISYKEFRRIAEHPEELKLAYEMPNREEYIVVGVIDNDLGLDMIVPDGYYEKLCEYQGVKTKKMLIYTKDKEEVKEFLEHKIDESLHEKLNIILKDPYEEQLKEYKEARNIKVDARLMITITIFVVSMLILYFMMKANAIARIQDIGVYRLLGISKSGIVSLFAYESFFLTCITSLAGAVVTTAVTMFISNIPSLNMQIIYPWYAFAGTLIFLYAVNIIVGILPIIGILKLPPAQLAAKYDI